MKGLEQLREEVARFLRSAGIDAVTAWNNADRVRRRAPVVAVSLRGVQGGPAGLADYLGEWLDPESGKWEERYGRRAKLTLGLDIYAPESSGGAGCAAAFARLGEALAGGRPAGLDVEELSCGEAAFDKTAGLFRCPAQMTCRVFLYASRTEDGVFTDFEVRGKQA